MQKSIFLIVFGVACAYKLENDPNVGVQKSSLQERELDSLLNELYVEKKLEALLEMDEEENSSSDDSKNSNSEEVIDDEDEYLEDATQKDPFLRRIIPIVTRVVKPPSACPQAPSRGKYIW